MLSYKGVLVDIVVRGEWEDILHFFVIEGLYIFV